MSKQIPLTFGFQIHYLMHVIYLQYAAAYGIHSTISKPWGGGEAAQATLSMNSPFV